MPNMDRTGPQGKGPMTGRGRGFNSFPQMKDRLNVTVKYKQGTAFKVYLRDSVLSTLKDYLSNDKVSEQLLTLETYDGTEWCVKPKDILHLEIKKY